MECFLTVINPLPVGFLCDVACNIVRINVIDQDIPFNFLDRCRIKVTQINKLCALIRRGLIGKLSEHALDMYLPLHLFFVKYTYVFIVIKVLSFRIERLAFSVIFIVRLLLLLFSLIFFFDQ